MTQINDGNPFLGLSAVFGASIDIEAGSLLLVLTTCLTNAESVVDSFLLSTST